ncbi:MAG: TonB family protein, partial [Prosthecobacter sp.]
VGLAHGLLGLLIWTFLPMLVPKKAGSNEVLAKLVWRSPSDFVMAAVPPPAEPPAPTLPAPAASSAMSSAQPAVTTTEVSGKPKVLNFFFGGSKDKAAPVAATIPESGKMQVVSSVSSPITSMMSGNVAVAPSLLPQGLTINSLGSSPLMSAAPLPMTTAQNTLPEVVVSSPNPSPETAAKPIASMSVMTGQEREPNKYITLSAIFSAKESIAPPRPGKPVLNLLDIAALNESKRAQAVASGGADMAGVENSLQQAILREWKPPPIKSVPATQRRATLEISVLRDGQVRDATVKTSSGSEALDASIRSAVERVSKIPETLPSSFPKERYDLRVNFQIE